MYFVTKSNRGFKAKGLSLIDKCFGLSVPVTHFTSFCLLFYDGQIYLTLHTKKIKIRQSQMPFITKSMKGIQEFKHKLKGTESQRTSFHSGEEFSMELEEGACA